jgi:aspartate/methionine/tyrosine aminotransferase
MFSVKNDDPFIIFKKLQDIARKEVGDENVIDLSRGDPGFGFTPSIRGREFASYIIFLDTVLNSDSENRFTTRKDVKNSDSILKQIKNITFETYKEDVANKLISELEEFIEFSISAAIYEGKDWQKEDVLWELFSYAAMSGGSYLNPHGQTLTRIITAAWHRSELEIDIKSEDVILTNGASHAIGTVFKLLGEEGCGYLKKGDSVAIASPVYSPYNRIIEERGLKPISYTMDPITGELSSLPINTKPKAIILIDPNNPTGFSLSQDALNTISKFAKDSDALVITDEVYSSFFPKKETMIKVAPERTICINARSKTERSTGLRSGEIIIMPEGRENIAKMIGLSDSENFEQFLMFSKAPGRTGGQFQHTTFVPGPSQLLSMSHIVLGTRERKAYMKNLKNNRDTFCKGLNLPHKNNTYYIIFDLDSIDGCTKKDLSVEDKLILLAKAGVVFIPAYRFFAETDREKSGVLTSVRASIVNTTADKLNEAAERVREALCMS